jgi:hypothetical protein
MLKQINVTPSFQILGHFQKHSSFNALTYSWDFQQHTCIRGTHYVLRPNAIVITINIIIIMKCVYMCLFCFSSHAYSIIGLLAAE